MTNDQHDLSTLTTLEASILPDLLESWDSNGGDFGFIEDIASVPMKQGRGVVSSLVKKGILEVHEATTTDSGRWTQFDFTGPDDGRELGERIRRLVDEGAPSGDID